MFNCISLTLIGICMQIEVILFKCRQNVENVLKTENRRLTITLVSTEVVKYLKPQVYESEYP